MVTSQPTLRYLSQLIAALAVMVTLSGCSAVSAPSETAYSQYASAQMAQEKPEVGLSLQSTQDEFESLVKNVDIKSRILNHYASWKGVRYRLGGTSKQGVDCSSFVQITFREQFGLDLPRSTSMQQSIGQQIKRDRLRPGDLILFRSGSTGRHIGIYIGNDNFVHASSSSGVMISSLNQKYWKSRYQQARRILSNG